MTSSFASPRAGWVLLTLLLLLVPARGPNAEETSLASLHVEVFVREGCPHCDAAKVFLKALQSEHPTLRVELIDVRRDAAGLQRLKELSHAAGVETVGVPTFHIAGNLVVGFESAESTGAQLRSLVEAVASRMTDVSASPPPLASAGDTDQTVLLFNRRLSVEELGLPLFTIVIGLLDGFNPCSMWVLILILSLLASLSDRRRMLVVAGTFVAVEALVYLAFLAAWLNVFLFVGLSRASEIVVGLLAVLAGLINVKDCVAFGRGITLSIPQAAKPRIYLRLRAILSAGSLWPAISGTVILALLVQIVELLCTSGLPALYTRVLTLRQLDVADYYAYLLLYIVMYMLDDLLVLAIGVSTMSQRRLQEQQGRLLKLISGIVMLALGVYLVIPS